MGAQKRDAAKSAGARPAVADAIDVASLWTMVERGDDPQLSVEERAARGKAARKDAPRSSQGFVDLGRQRTDPVLLLEEQAKSRPPELAALRHRRMLISPFAYFRGAVASMASDLSKTTQSGFVAQLCGDAHLNNFGIFDTVEGTRFFDIDSFDESAPGPWEWDLKRLCASLEISARDNQFTSEQRREIVRSSARSYREAMRDLAGLPIIEVWNSKLDVGSLSSRFALLLDSGQIPAAWYDTFDARAQESHPPAAKMTKREGEKIKLKNDPPFIVPIEEFGWDLDSSEESKWVPSLIRSYAQSLQPELRHLLDQYRLTHVARKVVGIGSVGRDSWVALLSDDSKDSHVLLQITQAETSAIERFWTKTAFSNFGQRVVYGRRLMQAGDDLFLGWERDTRGGRERDYVISQVRHWRLSADAVGMTAAGMELWGRMCGWALARAHARSGDRISISHYLGKSDRFDRALVKFSEAYANQNEIDFDSLKKAVKKGRITAE